MLHGTGQACCLYEIVDGCTLLLLRFLVEGYELQLSLVPSVVIGVLAEEYLAVGGMLDVGNLKLAADV